MTLPEEQGAVEQVIAGKSDLAYTVAIEILPTIELADFKGIQLERVTAEAQNVFASGTKSTAKLVSETTERVGAVS